MSLHRTCRILRVLLPDQNFGRESLSSSLSIGKTLWYSPTAVDPTSRKTWFYL
jgi:hypothetical protein